MLVPSTPQVRAFPGQSLLARLWVRFCGWKEQSAMRISEVPELFSKHIKNIPTAQLSYFSMHNMTVYL